MKPDDSRRLPKWLVADVERGLIKAYYEHVQRCQVGLNDPYGGGPYPFVAMAVRSGIVYGMDFSTHYHFPTEMHPGTAVRRAKARAEELQRWAQFHGSGGPSFRAIYEIWCFILPNEKVLRVAEALRENPVEGVEAQLVSVEEVHERIRQTVIALPPEDPEEPDLTETAFEWAGRLIRKAFDLRGSEPR